MKLTADERPEPDLGDDPLRPRGGAFGLGSVGVGEVVPFQPVDLRPAHPPGPDARADESAAGHEAEAGHAALVRELQRELEPEADAENRPASSKRFAVRRGGAGAIPPAQRRPTDAGQHGDVAADASATTSSTEAAKCTSTERTLPAP